MQEQVSKCNFDSDDKTRYWSRWWNKIVALIILCNLLLVLFDGSYLRLRDVYLRELPFVVHLYDPIKGIEGHPLTQHYLDTVDTLSQRLSTQGIQAPQIEKMFSELRQQSIALVDDNPFLSANKLGTFAKLKRRMQSHLDTFSAKQAFVLFWSQNYFSQVGWTEALSFFDAKIRPLFEVNYFRMASEEGRFVDGFWRIDLYFSIFFGVECLARTLLVSLNQIGITWWDAIARRWYEGFLFLPAWRWLRVVPATVRLHRSGLVNLERILAQVTYEPAAYLADRVSEFILVRLISQTQDSINSGGLTDILTGARQYTRIGDIDKVDALIDKLLELIICKALPTVQPDVENLLRHSLRGALKQSNLYQIVQLVPGIESLPKEVIEQLADYLAQASYNILAVSYADAEGKVLLDRLNQDFKAALSDELQDEATRQELQSLLFDLLEELKLNYIKGSVQRDPEATLTEVDQLRQEMTES